MEEKWYNKAWFMWITLICFSPVGIYLMWKNKKFSSRTRKVLTGIFAIWFLFVVIGSSGDNNSQVTANKATEQNAQVQNSKKIENKTKIEEDARNTKEAKKVEEIKIKAQEEKTNALAKFNLKEVTVSRVVDGDTVELSDGSKVRLIGVNTPESTTRTEPYGKESSDYTKNQLTNKTVYLEKDVSETDKYGRLLRYVWLDIPKEISDSEIRTKMYNAILTTEGYAEASTYPPDVKYQEYFTKYNAEARNANKGLWAINPNGTTKGDGDKTTSSSSSSSASTSSNSSNSSLEIVTPAQPPQNNNNRLVYYVPKGKSYHYNKNCPTLSRSKTILEAPLQDVINMGKSDPCDKCVY